ncbi:outer membrane chaperone Skp (OmpH) [Thiorhodococcus drewsii AZ1]|uniref:Outer membrane chaperone Skp (OmpH) n=1 Tax=Thiorhodococcus drewsii AZ1 TaxID=765913 RepID=G2E5B2_9GAMM|nr:OmpH family outer membrane protein [Thiorhodococcus drewsii]EGV28824.1 outer membrane chaperone Skp (OmpH) [Thiorhodococcus drewsii AZ1]
MTRLFLFAALSLSLVLPAYAGSAASIGYVDMQKVLEDSELGQRLQEQLRKEFESQAKELAIEEREINQLQQELARDKPLMSNDQVKKKEKEIETRITTYQKKAAPVQQELMKAQQKKGREIVAPARKAVNEVAKKKKLGMVVERGMSGLMYVDEGFDITADVIKQLDASTK